MSSQPASMRLAAVSPAAVPLWRLYLLRAAYLLLAVGLATSVWPAMLRHEPWPLTLSPYSGVGNSILAAFPLLALLGLRYPLKLLPLLLLETLWKAIWLLAVALPLSISKSPIDDATAQTISACLMGVIFPLVIPWRYVFREYVTSAGDSWR